MGCIKSKIDPKICQRDETHSMHVDFIKKHGLQKYYQTLGIEPEEQRNSYEDNSKNLNLGLINIEEKTESDVENINMGLSVREWVEIGVLLIIILGILRVIYKFCLKRKKKSEKKSQIKKKKALKEVMQSVAAPNQEMMLKTVTQVPATITHQENNEKQVVPYVEKQQVVPYVEKPMPVSVNVSRLPLFPSSNYS